MSTPHLRPSVNDRDHSAGPPDAPITLVEYGDFECPFCGLAYPIVKEAQRELGSRLRFVFRHFPLAEIHPHARMAAAAAEAAGVQGRFWEMHHMLLENQRALEPSDLIGYARTLGLDELRFAHELETGVHASRVKTQFISGIRSGVNGTPTFFVNGFRFDGPWMEERALLRALHDAGQAVAVAAGTAHPRDAS